MNIFSPRPKRSRRASRVPFNPWNYNPSLGYAWSSSPYSSPSTLPWTFPPSPTPSPGPFSPSSWMASTPYDWGNPWYPQSPFSTPQAPWNTLLPPWHPSYSSHTYDRCQPTLNWDISTHPTSHDNQGKFSDLTATVPDNIEKIRIYVEKPAISYWTKQWGYATAYKRGGKAISLLDVLEAIYNYFQEPVSIDVLPPQYQSMLSAAYTERVAKSGAAYTGLARVDVLNGNRILYGMRPLSYGNASGTMYIALHLRKA
ncbi:hypothetical protein B0H11DRAFT_1277524 [Mycena galericulata]|nr:hypothetical protein B0H11DRAFT_1277524 [Mycena galericulata]